MDRVVCSLVTMIEEQGLTKNIIIVFTSDKGGERSDKNHSTDLGHNSHGPLRGKSVIREKILCYMPSYLTW